MESHTNISADVGKTPLKAAKKLVLCFDGTSNKFNATERDSNIVKIYEMLNRNTSDQFHYYQPGIGTYEPGKLSNSTKKGYFAAKKADFRSTWDQMFGTSFVDHVIAGYQFILKYYTPGDKIYVFGFSRGAYTARFLSEMIDNIGLLSMGNDEMIQFAWDTFSDYQRLPGKVDLTTVKISQDITIDLEESTGTSSATQTGFTNGGKPADPYLPTDPPPKILPGVDENYGLGGEEGDNGNNGGTDLYNHGADALNSKDDSKPATKQEAYEFMQVFKSTFCRPGVRVYLLGLFDCVNSVATFNSTKNMSPYLLQAPARHIRHALSLHERRAMFRPSLFLIDEDNKKNYPFDSFKEVWFAGNHGDVGGGWWITPEDKKKSPENYLISDIPLKWMVTEILALEKNKLSRLAWHMDKVQWLTRHAYSQTMSWSSDTEVQKVLTRHSLHDPLKRGAGLTNLAVLRWRMMELLPFSRYEYDESKNPNPWVSKWFPPNYGASRAVPVDALIHSSVFELGRLDFIPYQRYVAEDRGFWLSRFFRFVRKKELENLSSGKITTLSGNEREDDVYLYL